MCRGAVIGFATTNFAVGTVLANLLTTGGETGFGALTAGKAAALGAFNAVEEASSTVRRILRATERGTRAALVVVEYE